ncbi:hypothetical protein M3A49_16875 [Paraburkholderia sp. CNPSo 3076]|uniref:hypothetical protein n=1 Tax=Paraburkholderia sp. CNPSo 3076 TaxID=2940936 RepID=UPI00225B172B|nr:hypothetical protein [Paraburkholderia sp. CNPSo 3076]MCX5541149.1 hypothetical protein [Paraburkholderia sp. CNPSo 3076]
MPPVSTAKPPQGPEPTLGPMSPGGLYSLLTGMAAAVPREPVPVPMTPGGP